MTATIINYHTVLYAAYDRPRDGDVLLRFKSTEFIADDARATNYCRFVPDNRFPGKIRIESETTSSKDWYNFPRRLFRLFKNKLSFHASISKIGKPRPRSTYSTYQRLDLEDSYELYSRSQF